MLSSTDFSMFSLALRQLCGCGFVMGKIFARDYFLSTPSTGGPGSAPAM